MTTERIQPNPENPQEIRRENFGPGHAGDWAFQIISEGTTCVTYIGDDGSECGQRATGTVDVDIRGELDLFPSCDEHSSLLREQLVNEIEKNGGYTVASNNGFGRA